MALDSNTLRHRCCGSTAYTQLHQPTVYSQSLLALQNQQNSSMGKEVGGTLETE